MNPSSAVSEETVIAATRNWLEKAVIDLNLCPFARSVHIKHQIRYAVSAAHDPETLLADLNAELERLTAADPAVIDTTLLIHPGVLRDFLDFNDFLALADELLKARSLEGEIQIASFHPHYQFAGTEADAVENYTNRSPYPILHLLRESSIDRAVAAFPEASAIYERNIQTLERLGVDGWRRLFSGAP